MIIANRNIDDGRGGDKQQMAGPDDRINNGRGGDKHQTAGPDNCLPLVRYILLFSLFSLLM